MSKVTELRAKYPNIIENTFKRFVDGDKTPTKKYLEYLLRSWVDRKTNHAPNSVDNLIKLVNSFDKIIPYIENKDIYSNEYKDLLVLKSAIDKGEQIKEDKTFVRDEHCHVLFENENYLFIRPLTHRGSLKYGSNTKWCVASKTDPQTFKTYTNTGLLVYLIDKTNKTKNLFNKIAFYLRYGKSSFNEKVELFNVIDSRINHDESFFNNGWDTETIVTSFQMFRTYHHYMTRYKESQDYVKKVTKLIEEIDPVRFEFDLSVVGKNKFEITPLIDKINGIHKSLTKIEYGFTET
jgi:hypothetical protein